MFLNIIAQITKTVLSITPHRTICGRVCISLCDSHNLQLGFIKLSTKAVHIKQKAYILTLVITSPWIKSLILVNLSSALWKGKCKVCLCLLYCTFASSHSSPYIHEDSSSNSQFPSFSQVPTVLITLLTQWILQLIQILNLLEIKHSKCSSGFKWLMCMWGERFKYHFFMSGNFYENNLVTYVSQSW